MTNDESVDDDEHFPWNYTEYGVVCSCGSAMDNDETCLESVRCPRSMVMGPQCELRAGHDGEHKTGNDRHWTDESQQKLLKGYRLD